MKNLGSLKLFCIKVIILSPHLENSFYLDIKLYHHPRRHILSVLGFVCLCFPYSKPHTRELNLTSPSTRSMPGPLSACSVSWKLCFVGAVSQGGLALWPPLGLANGRGWQEKVSEEEKGIKVFNFSCPLLTLMQFWSG